MKGIIDDYNFAEMEAMKYYAPPASWDKEKRKTIVKNNIFSEEWLAAEKKDGFFAKFVKDEDNNILFYSRTRNVNGEYVNKIEWVPQFNSFFEIVPKGTCFLGELYFPKQPGSHNVTTIMGCLKDKALLRQEKGEKLHYYIFDVLAWNGQSFLKKTANERFNFLNTIQYSFNIPEYIEFAKYLKGKELWDNLQLILASGGEGIVIIKQDSLYEPGKRPSKTTLKVKKELQETIDCFFTGRIAAPTRLYSGTTLPSWPYWENVKTGEKIEGNFYRNYLEGEPIEPVTKPYFMNMAGSLEIGVLRDGKVYPLGWLSGLTDEMKTNYKNYKGKCLEVAAMQFTDDKALRHAKMVQLRPDLTIQDCTWDKLGI